MAIAKNADLQEWTRLAAATIRARDDLRTLAADLTAAMAARSIPGEMIVRARDVAAQHADGLRLALKHPGELSRRKFNRDRNLPCWMEPS